MKLVVLVGLVAAGFGVAAHADPTGDALSAKAHESIISTSPKVATK